MNYFFFTFGNCQFWNKPVFSRERYFGSFSVDAIWKYKHDNSDNFNFMRNAGTGMGQKQMVILIVIFRLWFIVDFFTLHWFLGF